MLDVDLAAPTAAVPADEELNLVGSDDAVGKVHALRSGGRYELRIDGLRKRVGGAVVDVGEGSLVVELDPWLESELCRSRFEGEGGNVSSSGSPSSSASDSKSNILAKSSPTFGELTKRLASSVGVGVASGCPVWVRMTPFIAEGIHSEGRALLRLIGVSTFVQSCDWRFSRVRLCSSVICTRGASKCFTSSKGVLSFRPC